MLRIAMLAALDMTDAAPMGREMTDHEIFISRVKGWATRLRRRFPFIVWYDAEIDVTVTFREDPLRQTDPLAGFERGRLPEIKRLLNEIGVTFDSGQGPGGRDWEWDWSLSGPISVRFRRLCRRPERRTPSVHHMKGTIQ